MLIRQLFHLWNYISFQINFRYQKMGNGMKLHPHWVSKIMPPSYQVKFKRFMKISFANMSKYTTTGLLQKCPNWQVNKLLKLLYSFSLEPFRHYEFDWEICIYGFNHAAVCFSYLFSFGDKRILSPYFLSSIGIICRWW